MLTGWYPAFNYARPLEQIEWESELHQSEFGEFYPDDAVGMTTLNSTYLEFIDRTFKTKGMAATAMSAAGSIFMIAVLVQVAITSLGTEDDLIGSLIGIAVLSVPALGFPFYFWNVHLHKDLFQYTHYPVRFNRITRRIYFFRHNGPGGVVVVPWGSPYAFFHIGRGGQDPSLRDLRCHLLDRHRQVQQTFTIGHFWNHDDDIREQWALICRYMKDGPEQCFDDPLDRVITLSPKGTLRNCWMLVCLMMGTTLFPLRYTLMFPIYGALTLSRWLTFKTCRAPVFPPELEAECAIAPGDPYALPEPRFMAEFASDPAIYARALQRHRERMLWR
ncbi:DUF6708 domain-containing protein [Stenotrophomonas sp. LGBM10]|uniref:DUF6708 domain-containing protein n=1 Tax=Stenotrophomonas sp. LGBM10 TaxID=3390038 RepID=UPI00398A764B